MSALAGADDPRSCRRSQPARPRGVLSAPMREALDHRAAGRHLGSRRASSILGSRPAVRSPDRAVVTACSLRCRPARPEPDRDCETSTHEPSSASYVWVSQLRHRGRSLWPLRCIRAATIASLLLPTATSRLPSKNARSFRRSPDARDSASRRSSCACKNRLSSRPSRSIVTVAGASAHPRMPTTTDRLLASSLGTHLRIAAWHTHADALSQGETAVSSDDPPQGRR